MTHRIAWRPLAALSALGIALSSVFGTIEARQQKPTFEVASIRRNTSAEPGGTVITTRGDSFRATRATLHRLILSVYGIPEDRLDGGPNWLQADRFDIDARALGEVPREQMRLMAQALLEERFGLMMSTEQREKDVYLLRLARADGGLGPDLRRAADDCDRDPSDPLARVKMMPRPSNGSRPSTLDACATIDLLAGALARALKTDVIDQTGLTGKWDYVVAHNGLQPSTASAVIRPGIDDRPSIFAAVEEQLGLKLERQRGLVEYFIVKSAHQPTDN
jgi:uncharacterized protein (TIGR03435 family)